MIFATRFAMSPQGEYQTAADCMQHLSAKRARRINKNGACRCPPKWAHLRTRTNQNAGAMPLHTPLVPSMGHGKYQEERTDENEDQAIFERGGDWFRHPALAATRTIERAASTPRRGHRRRRHRRRRHRRQRPGSRRLGDRGNQRSADALHQDRRHRRSRPLRRARSAESQLQGLGARLRSGRFAEDAERARQDRQSARNAGAERRGSRTLLSGDLLVLDAEDSGREASSAARATSPKRSRRPTGSRR